ncbi:NGG1p interacting factor 3 [Hypomontagnella submonticulosa]|nr:NGG1p interacting factor 3 [Hypomontagnella submonticulosa]
MSIWQRSSALKLLSRHTSGFSSPFPYLVKTISSVSVASTCKSSKLPTHNQSWNQQNPFAIIKQIRTFSSSTIMAAPPATCLTDAVVAAMRTLFPEELADSAWDNTGLLLGQAPLPPSSKAGVESRGTVLLTNDLTSAVVDEALKEGAQMIVCYHPIIFRPLKSLTTKDPMQTLLLRLAAERISVYCPHTAMDAASGGLNDWLCDILLDGEHQVKRTVAQPISRPLPEGHQGTGYGRIVELTRPVTLQTLLKRLSAGIGNQRYMMVALPPTLDGLTKTQEITKVAVCAGSGSDVLKDTDAQVLVTGEMAHHYALRHTQLGQIVVTVFHSNSERKYLETRLKPMLEVELETTKYGDTRVIVSKADRDPFEVIDVRDLA